MSNSRTFEIQKDYWCNGVDLFKNKNLTFNPGYTTLIGCNGSGKSTILLNLNHQFKKDNIPFYYYNNYSSGGQLALHMSQYRNEDGFLRRATSSEGENIHINFEEHVRKIGKDIQTLSVDCLDKNKEYWILLDAIDSGASIDNIVEMKEFFNLVIDDAKRIGITVFIIVVANSYELVRGSMPFDVRHCKYITINSYEEYYDFIMESSKIKEQRYNDINNSDYKVKYKN